MKIIEILRETATSGATSAGSIASIPNPNVAVGNKRARQAYGKGKNPSPPKVKSVNALDSNISLFGGELLKR